MFLNADYCNLNGKNDRERSRGYRELKKHTEGLKKLPGFSFSDEGPKFVGKVPEPITVFCSQVNTFPAGNKIYISTDILDYLLKTYRKQNIVFDIDDYLENAFSKGQEYIWIDEEILMTRSECREWLVNFSEEVKRREELKNG